jgi:hypothetical protein
VNRPIEGIWYALAIAFIVLAGVSMIIAIVRNGP